MWSEVGTPRGMWLGLRTENNGDAAPANGTSLFCDDNGMMMVGYGEHKSDPKRVPVPVPLLAAADARVVLPKERETNSQKLSSAPPTAKRSNDSLSDQLERKKSFSTKADLEAAGGSNQITDIRVSSHYGAVTGLASLSGNRLVSGGNDSMLHVWTLGHPTRSTITGFKSGEHAGLKEPELKLKGHTGAISRVVTLQDGRVVSASSDGTVRVWTIPSTTPPVVLTLKSQPQLASQRVNSSQSRFSSRSQFAHRPSHAQQSAEPMFDPPAIVDVIALESVGMIAAATGGDNLLESAICFWKLPPPNSVDEVDVCFLYTLDSRITCLCKCPGNRIMSAGDRISVWDLLLADDDAAPVSQHAPTEQKLIREGVTANCMAPVGEDSNDIAVGDSEGRVSERTICSITACTHHLQRLPVPHPHPQVYVWKLEPELHRYLSFDGHHGPVTHLSYLTRTSLLISTSKDGSSRVWPLSPSDPTLRVGTETVAIIRPCGGGPVLFGCPLGDGESLIAYGCDNGSIFIRDVPMAEEVALLVACAETVEFVDTEEEISRFLRTTPGGASLIGRVGYDVFDTLAFLGDKEAAQKELFDAFVAAVAVERNAERASTMRESLGQLVHRMAFGSTDDVGDLASRDSDGEALQGLACTAIMRTVLRAKYKSGAFFVFLFEVIPFLGVPGPLYLYRSLPRLARPN